MAPDPLAYRPGVPPRLVPLDYRRLPEGEMVARSDAFLASLRRRRTVRDFSPEDVPWQVVENAIAAAGLAPSGANQQPWTFVVVTDPGLKRRIREAAEAEERRSYEGRMPDEWLRALEPLGTDWHKPHLEDAPVLVVVFEQAYGLGAHGERVKHYYVKESVGIAVGFLLAALHEAGLVTLTHTPSPMGFLREALDRPANERPYVVVPVGYPASGARVPAVPKKALTEILVRRE
jgi:iodotyrosine deiodinase